MRTPKRLQSEAEVFGSVFFLAQHLARKSDAAMESLGITSKQWLLLAVMQRQFPDQAPSLSEVAAWYGSSRQNVKMIAQQLEGQGFLRIEPDRKDRRILRLHLTDRVSILDSARERARQTKLMDELFAWATDEELRSISQLLRKWTNEIAAEGGLQ